MKFETMDDVRLANRQAGYHFFDPDTLRFFRSRIGRELYGGRYFVTSEQNSGYVRLYTIRRAALDGKITTVGEFQRYHSGAAARLAVRSIA